MHRNKNFGKNFKKIFKINNEQKIQLLKDYDGNFLTSTDEIEDV